MDFDQKYITYMKTIIEFLHSAVHNGVQEIKQTKKVLMTSMYK